MTTHPDAKACPWQAALEILQLQLSKPVFVQRLAGTVLLSQDGDCYRVAVPDETTQAWLHHQLRPKIEQALSSVVGEATTVDFVVQTKSQAPQPELLADPDSAQTPSSPLLTDPDPNPINLIDWRDKRNKGYTPADQYDLIFWQAWLNRQNCRAYGLWLALQTDDKRNTFSKEFQDWWTPPRPYRIRELAAACGAGASTPALTGRFTPCTQCEKALRSGHPLTTCCQAHQPTRWKALPDGGKICQYWSLGAFECLQQAGLLAVAVRPGKTKGHQLRLQVWRLLPPLTPHQVSDLPAILQVRHDHWLHQHGPTFNLSQSQWEQIEQPSLVPQMRDYQSHRQLGTYTWNKIAREAQ